MRSTRLLASISAPVAPARNDRMPVNIALVLALAAKGRFLNGSDACDAGPTSSQRTNDARDGADDDSQDAVSR